MARLELIKELEIRRKEIYSEIKIQLPQLTEQLEAIDKIIGSNIDIKTGDTNSESVITTSLTNKKNYWNS